MGFSKSVIDGILAAGYNAPTHIQKEAIPTIMNDQDVVAMARTGSGKTACFLLPMFEKLGNHQINHGPRALVITPTKELANQTLKFAQKLGKYTGLKCALVIGGESLDQQFGALHKEPDIIIATPGRLVHICTEMGRRLDTVQYVVFDEADRLFELGFREQLEDILGRLSSNRQTLLFSATLPSMLADFAKSGLRNPNVIRLDKDEKLSKNLKLAFFKVSPQFKLHLLVYLVDHVISQKISNNQKVLVFCATMHCVQFTQTVFETLGIKSSYLYSEMDPSARRINVDKFIKGISNIMVATDVAARGIDIPDLDVVINYTFPADPKTFVHRVGRVARVNRDGVAFNFVSQDEEAYLWDLHVFLGRKIDFTPTFGPEKLPITETYDWKEDRYADWHYKYGAVPDVIVKEMSARLDPILSDENNEYQIEKVQKSNATYKTCRPKPSKEAIRGTLAQRRLAVLGQHPFLITSLKESLEFTDDDLVMEKRRQELIHMMKNRLHTKCNNKTVFERGIIGTRKTCRQMKLKRKRDEAYIEEHHKKINVKVTDDSKDDDIKEHNPDSIFKNVPKEDLQVEEAEEDSSNHTDIVNTRIQSKPKRGKSRCLKRKLKKQEETPIAIEEPNNNKEEDAETEFIPYVSKDHYSERGYAINQTAGHFEIQQDTHKSMMQSKVEKKRIAKKDMKKKGETKIKTESGKFIAASYKTNHYDKWLKRQKAKTGCTDEDLAEAFRDQDSGESSQRFAVVKGEAFKSHPLRKAHDDVIKKTGKVVKQELRNEDQITKFNKQKKAEREEFKKTKELGRIRDSLLKKNRKKASSLSAVKSRNIQRNKLNK